MPELVGMDKVKRDAEIRIQAASAQKMAFKFCAKVKEFAVGFLCDLFDDGRKTVHEKIFEVAWIFGKHRRRRENDTLNIWHTLTKVVDE